MFQLHIYCYQGNVIIFILTNLALLIITFINEIGLFCLSYIVVVEMLLLRQGNTFFLLLITHNAHNVEQLFICIEFKFKIFIINDVYLFPSSLLSMYDSSVVSDDFVIRQHPNNLFICCSDLTITEITW